MDSIEPLHNDNLQRERQDYVPASVMVIEIAKRGVICISGDTSNEEYTNNDNPNWFL